MTRKPSPAVFRSEELDLFLKGKMDPDDKFLKWIEDMEKVLKENIFAGDQVKKDRIPYYYIRRYGVNNLFRYDHPEGYRSCYVVSYVDGIGVCPTILDILSHDQYNKIFGYKKR